MFERLRTITLRLLRVPHDPAPPVGAAGSLRVFRAGRNLYKLRLLRWGLGQVGALAGIVFSVVFLTRIEKTHEELRARQQPTTATASPAAVPAASPTPATATVVAPVAGDDRVEAAPSTPARKSSAAARKRVPSSLVRVIERWPWWVFPLLKLLEFGAILTFLAQIPLTYAMVRLDYELRWYMVTDRSLRIRTGLASVLESTMSFANVQQVVVTQGPIQRLLGIADVRVQSAGGGGDDTHGKGQGDSLHSGVFHGVDNAAEIRDLILERLRQFRATGLGDPDDAPAAPAADGAAVPGSDALTAARAMLAEARALRQAVG